jgi:hypothetical protein
MFQCDSCFKEFNRKDNRIRHKKSAHSTSDDEDAKEDIFGIIDEKEEFSDSDNDSGSDIAVAYSSEESLNLDP